MSNNANNKSTTGSKNGTNSGTLKKGKKRSAAAQARRTAKWASHKANKKAASLSQHTEKKEAANAKKDRVLSLFPTIMGLVGAQGFMPNIRRVKTVSKSINHSLNTVPLFQNTDRATIYPNGSTVLGQCIESKSWDKAIETLNKGVPKRILDHPLANGKTPLQEAYETNQFALFQRLLEKGADPNTMILTSRVQSPILIHIINHNCYWGSTNKFIDQLYRHKADLNKRDTSGYTALDRAIQLKQFNTAQFLIAKGVELESPNANGFTPVLTAIQKSNKPIFQEMIAKGINIDKQTGPSILFPVKVAVISGSQQILEAVLDHHPKTINTKDADGNTPLHYAVKINALAKIALLKSVGANPAISNKQGLSALNLAQALESSGDARAYNLLKE